MLGCAKAFAKGPQPENSPGHREQADPCTGCWSLQECEAVYKFTLKYIKSNVHGIHFVSGFGMGTGTIMTNRASENQKVNSTVWEKVGASTCQRVVFKG